MEQYSGALSHNPKVLGQIHHLAAAFLSGIMLIGDLKFPIGVNGCVFLCLSPMTDW